MKCKLADIAEFNPKETIKKGTVAKKIAMDKLRPFCRDIPEYELAPFTGGAKFRNGDTIMARITPCLENGKTAKVNVLGTGEVGFGSTEFLVFRANKNITDEDYLYYLVCSPIVRDIAIKSMIGSSGRQRVQTDVVQNIEIDLPSLGNQKRIGNLLRSLDDKIELNNKINANLEQQAQALFNEICKNGDSFSLADILEVCYGKDHKRLRDGGVPCYGTGGVMRYVERALYEGESVLIPRKGSLNNVMYVNEAFWTVDTLFYTRMKRPNIAKLVYFFLCNLNLAKMNVGSAVPSMTTAILNAIEITLPDEETCSRFERIVSPMFLQIQSNKIENCRLAKIRDVLLQALIGSQTVKELDL